MVSTLFLFWALLTTICSGGSRGGDGEGGGVGAGSFCVGWKKEEMTEGRIAGWASKINLSWPPSLARNLDLPLICDIRDWCVMLLIQGLPFPLKPLPCAHFHATTMISFLVAGILLASVKESRPQGKTGRRDKLLQLLSRYMFRHCYWTCMHSHNQTWTRILWFGFLILSCSITAGQKHGDFRGKVVPQRDLFWKGCKESIVGQKSWKKFRLEELVWLIVAFLYWLMQIIYR